MKRAAWMAPAAVVGCILGACNGTSSQNDSIYPACNKISPEGLATESTPQGQCPQKATTLVGTATVGAPCSQSSDCAPYCCTCPGASTSALAAQCAGGSCLDGADTCCLFAQQCAN